MSRVDARLRFIEPQIPTLGDQPPEGSDWIHEVKHDGYRTVLLVHLGEARAYTRNGFDWSDRYPGIISSAAKLKVASAILDGEVIVQDARGVSDFEALKSAIRWRPESLIFYAFDLLHLNGIDLRSEPLLERRSKLRELIGADSRNPLQYSDELVGDGAKLFRACSEYGLEGIVSKRGSSRYRSGRSKTWLKTKCFTESEFVLIGTDRDRKTGALRALLARADAQGLAYAGAAFIALPSEERDELTARLEAITTELPAIPRLRLKGAQWVKPDIIARVRHLAGAKSLRHGTVRCVIP
jgi:bifunctional non-homologous end joining protein LigD